MIKYLIILFSILFFTPNVFAVDEKTLNLGKKVWKERIKCGYCHGPFGNGAGNPRSPGLGANIRETQLDRDGLYLVVACGIPGTEMPYFHRSAYKKPEICWDMLAEDMGEDMPKKHENNRTLNEKSISALVEYILADIKGRGPITLEECEEYFSVGSRKCNGFRDK